MTDSPSNHPAAGAAALDDARSTVAAIFALYLSDRKNDGTYTLDLGEGDTDRLIDSVVDALCAEKRELAALTARCESLEKALASAREQIEGWESGDEDDGFISVKQHAFTDAKLCITSALTAQPKTEES